MLVLIDLTMSVILHIMFVLLALQFNLSDRIRFDT